MSINIDTVLAKAIEKLRYKPTEYSKDPCIVCNKEIERVKSKNMRICQAKCYDADKENPTIWKVK